MGKGVIIALDFSNREETMKFLDLFQDEKLFVKIGYEIFYSEGPSIVEEIKRRGHKIFLDLKLHDIPNTVEKGMRSLSRLGVDMTNVHAAGTIDMMKAGLTQLTSTSQERMEEEILIHEPIEDVVMHYAENAKKAGLDGVVCSPLEVQKVKERCGKEFITVTPGIRFTSEKKDDQTRIATPALAKEIGSDYIVVGRPITKAENPLEAYRKCVEDFVG